MSFFNAFQVTGLFAGWPFIVGWLFDSADFPGVAAAKWLSVVIYIVGYFLITACVGKAIQEST